MAAVQGSHYETVKYILTVGININEKTKYAREESVLDMARSRKDVKMIRLLKKAGAK